ncbi:MAG: septum formation inhibitor Maf [Corallincola sp.]|nr:septum formation inhibitor Maf [Corallincola sp.]
MHRPLILASTSPYRRALLEKLGLPFACIAPQVDEQPQTGESAQALVERLARAKAAAIAAQYPDALVIGSDQVAVIDGVILGKPHSHDRAFAQLQAASGKAVTFLTGLALVHQAGGRVLSLVEPFEVKFRRLSEQSIEHYLRLEQPYDCAGSFKSEGLGISLFEALQGRDPNALIGLPLIALIDLLTELGYDTLAAARAAQSTRT